MVRTYVAANLQRITIQAVINLTEMHGARHSIASVCVVSATAYHSSDGGVLRGASLDGCYELSDLDSEDDNERHGSDAAVTFLATGRVLWRERSDDRHAEMSRIKA